MCLKPLMTRKAMVSDKTVALIPVRLTSTRLAEKHLKHIGPKSIISWVIHQLKRAGEIETIVICAPSEPEIEKLRPVADSEGVKLFIYDGSVDDVVGRLTRAAESFKADICVLASGDCPLLCPATIDSMVRLLKADPQAGHAAFALADGHLPIHEGIVISRLWLWQRAEQLSDTPALREHHFPVFLRGVYPERFSDVKVVSFKDDALFYSLRHRISVDTPLDLQFMNTLYDELRKTSHDFTLENAIELLQTNSAVAEINGQVYQKGFGEESYRVLFIPETGSGGSVLRCLEVAAALVHYHGIGAEFLAASDDTASVVSGRGFKATIGTRGEILKLSKRYCALVYDINNYFNIEIPLHGGCKATDNCVLPVGSPLDMTAAEIAKLVKR